MDVINFIKVSEKIYSSGQPSEQQFAEIAKLGVNTVINLAMSTSDNAVANEGDVVTELGMSYVHIPVQWEQPRIEQFRLFAAAMESQKEQLVWVHCALNMRVSAFIYLYRTIYQGEAEQIALERMSQIWVPNEIWSRFVGDVKAAALLI